MRQALTSLRERLAPAEEILFTWLGRVFAAATLVGSAWIDDAPPLVLAAMLLALYVAVRVVTELGALVSADPFQSRLLSALFSLGALVVLGGAFLTVAIFVERVALSVAG